MWIVSQFFKSSLREASLWVFREKGSGNQKLHNDGGAMEVKVQKESQRIWTGITNQWVSGQACPAATERGPSWKALWKAIASALLPPLWVQSQAPSGIWVTVVSWNSTVGKKSGMWSQMRNEDRLEHIGISATILPLMTRKRPSESKSCCFMAAFHVSYVFLTANSRKEPWGKGILGF